MRPDRRIKPNNSLGSALRFYILGGTLRISAGCYLNAVWGGRSFIHRAAPKAPHRNKESADDGNQALEFLRQEIGDMQKTSEELVSRLEGAEGSGNNPGSHEVALIEARELRDRLGKFRVAEDQEGAG